MFSAPARQTYWLFLTYDRPKSFPECVVFLPASPTHTSIWLQTPFPHQCPLTSYTNAIVPFWWCPHVHLSYLPSISSRILSFLVRAPQHPLWFSAYCWFSINIDCCFLECEKATPIIHEKYVKSLTKYHLRTYLIMIKYSFDKNFTFL